MPLIEEANSPLSTSESISPENSEFSSASMSGTDIALPNGNNRENANA